VDKLEETDHPVYQLDHNGPEHAFASFSENKTYVSFECANDDMPM